MTDSVLMRSRDGVNFFRENESFLRPGPERDGVWTYGSTYMSYGFAETTDPLTGWPEISLYATEQYRYRPTVLRQDGFWSWSAPWRGGRALTKPLLLCGDGFSLNFSTSAQGYVRMRICGADGPPLPGFDSGYLFGGSLRRAVPFEGDLCGLADTPVRLEFTLSDADLYSMECRDALPKYLKA